MQLFKFLRIIFLVIFISLAYVNMQMRIINLAYKEEQYKQRARELIEENGNINYKILTLKSANNIGVKVLSDNSDFRFGDPEQVRKILAPEISNAQQVSLNKPGTQITNPLLSLLSRKEKVDSGNAY